MPRLPTIVDDPSVVAQAPLPRLPFLDRESVANIQGLGSLPTVRLDRRIGRLSAEVTGRLKDGLAFALNLERASE
jgi:mRNA interferase MazF